MTTVLVTGGAGFVGSHVVDALVARGASVRVLDLLHPRAHAGAPPYLNPAAEYVWGDLRDEVTVRRVVAGVDAVSHQGGMVGLGQDFSDTPEYVSHNGSGTAVLLAALHRAGFAGRLVLASSMVVYGEGRFTCSVHGAQRPPPRRVEDLASGRFDPVCGRCRRTLRPEPVSEDATPDPRNVYAATKLHQEHLCAAFRRATGASVVALRYHNVYGPRLPKDTPYAGVASIFRSALEAGQAPQVFEDGRQLRDFVHVRDVAAANVLALLERPGVEGVFNVGSGQPHSVLEMAEALHAAVAGSAPRPRVTGQYRLGDVRHVFGTTTRAAEVLGFVAGVAFAAGMAESAQAPVREPVAGG